MVCALIESIIKNAKGSFERANMELMRTECVENEKEKKHYKEAAY